MPEHSKWWSHRRWDPARNTLTWSITIFGITSNASWSRYHRFAPKTIPRISSPNHCQWIFFVCTEKRFRVGNTKQSQMRECGINVGFDLCFVSMRVRVGLRALKHEFPTHQLRCRVYRIIFILARCFEMALACLIAIFGKAVPDYDRNQSSLIYITSMVRKFLKKIW